MSASHNAQLSWSFGLRNHEGKYLTVETFHSMINCNAAKMKKKQIFFLERGDGESVYIRTWANKYLSIDGDGNFTANSDEKTADAALTIEPLADGSWCIVSHRAQYIYGRGDKMAALIKANLPAGDQHKFTVHLAMHPQVCIRNVNRSRYLHLNTKGTPSITCDEDAPWGDDAVLNLDFNADGSYSIQTSAGTFLSNDGRLTDSVGDNNKFVLEFHLSQLAFRSKASQLYLTCAGGDGKLGGQENGFAL